MCAAVESINSEEDRRKREQVMMKECLVKLASVNRELKTAVTETKVVASDVVVKLNGLGICAHPITGERRVNTNGSYNGPERRSSDLRTPDKVKRKKAQPRQAVTHVAT